MKNLLKDAFIYGLGNFSSTLVAFVLIPVLTRTLSVDGYGALALANVFIVLGSNILGLGIGSSVFNELIHSESPDEKRSICGTAFISIFLACIFAVMLGFILLFFEGALVRRVFSTATFVFILLSILTGIITPVIFSVFRALNKVNAFCFLASFGAAMTLVFTIVCVFAAPGSVASVLLARSLSGFFTFLLAAYWLHDILAPAFSFPVLKKLLSFGLPLVPSSLMLWVLDLSDRFLLQIYRGTKEVGVYSLGYQYASVLSFPLIAFQLAWPQALIGYAQEKNGSRQVGRIFKYYIFFVSACAVFLISFTDECLALLGTSHFREARQVVPAVTAGYIFYGVYLLAVAGVYVRKDSRWVPWITFAGCAVNITGNVIFLPSYGILAAAYTTLSAYLVMAVVMWLSVYKTYPVYFRRHDMLRHGLLLAFGLFSSVYFRESVFSLRAALMIFFMAMYAFLGDFNSMFSPEAS